MIMLFRLVFFTILLMLIIVVTQDIQIFPRTIMPSKNKDFVPTGVVQRFVTTSDNKSLETWYLPASPEKKKNISVLVFHGNGDNLETTFQIQQWLASLGYASLSFDYRGYRNSSGWPSERGLYEDADTVWRSAVEQYGFAPKTTMLFGTSIGGAPALYLASKIQPAALVLLSPFISLKQLVREHVVFRYLVPFLWYEFPNVEYVAKLKSTSLLVAHGVRDGIIPFAHGEAVFGSYQGSGKTKFIKIPQAGHNDVLATSADEIATAMQELVAQDVRLE